MNNRMEPSDMTIQNNFQSTATDTFDPLGADVRLRQRLEISNTTENLTISSKRSSSKHYYQGECHFYYFLHNKCILTFSLTLQDKSESWLSSMRRNRVIDSLNNKVVLLKCLFEFKLEKNSHRVK